MDINIFDCLINIIYIFLISVQNITWFPQFLFYCTAHFCVHYSKCYKIPKTVIFSGSTRWFIWSGHCVTSRRVPRWISDVATEIFRWLCNSDDTSALEGDSSSNRNEYQLYWVGCKGGRCVELSTLPPYCAECLEIWEHQTTGALRDCQELYRDCFTFFNAKKNYDIPKTVTFCYVTLSNRHGSLFTHKANVRVGRRGKTNFMRGWHHSPCDEYVFVITLDNEAIIDLYCYTKNVYAPSSNVFAD